jgi:hypothetical protein
VALARGDDVVVGLVLLQHQPHRANIVARETPVALRVQIAERQRIRKSQLDPRDAVGHFPRDEFQTAARRLVIEQNSRSGKQVVALAIVDGDVVREDLGDAVRASGIKRRELGLRNFANLAEHLARRCLVQPDFRIHLTDGFEHACHALRIELPREHRLIPGRGHERHRGEVV